ncbi:MAG TPA: TetR/AcrR family transcriptional regulator [Capsulimonadaceae bacterium]|jgi:AcrR family transcriptional regulator
MKPKDTKDRIARATIELVAECGIDAVSMRDIARVVNVSEAAIYKHFANKNELIWEVFTTQYDLFAGRLSEIQSRHDRFTAKLTAMVEDCCRLFDEDCDLFVFLLVAQHIQRFAPKDFEAAMPAMLTALLDEAVLRGELPSQNAEATAAMVMGCVIQTALFCLYYKPTPKLMTPLSGELAAACRRIVQGE